MVATQYPRGARAADSQAHEKPKSKWNGDCKLKWLSHESDSCCGQCGVSRTEIGRLRAAHTACLLNVFVIRVTLQKSGTDAAWALQQAGY
jgi:hypothetical protein